MMCDAAFPCAAIQSHPQFLGEIHMTRILYCYAHNISTPSVESACFQSQLEHGAVYSGFCNLCPWTIFRKKMYFYGLEKKNTITLTLFCSYHAPVRDLCQHPLGRFLRQCQGYHAYHLERSPQVPHLDPHLHRFWHCMEFLHDGVMVQIQV